MQGHYLSMFVACAIACGGEPMVVTLPNATHGSSELGVGAYVVYRFSGSFTDKPVTVREEVIARDAGRVTIDVRAMRGREERRWTQIGPDTADARWNDIVDEIEVTLDGNRKQKLPNPDNTTLARLYEWVLASADGEATAHTSAACEQPIGAARFACTCDTETRSGARVIRSETSRCSTFAWQRGPARWTTPDGRVVWQVEVIETSTK